MFFQDFFFGRGQKSEKQVICIAVALTIVDPYLQQPEGLIPAEGYSQLE